MALLPELIKDAAGLARGEVGSALADEASVLLASGMKRNALGLEQLFGRAQIRIGERLTDGFDTDIKTGTIDVGRSVEHVMVRKFTPGRREKELTAYAIHGESPFTNHFPVTVGRPDGKVVQERIGRSLDTGLAILDKRFYGYEPPIMPPIDEDKHVIDAWAEAMREHERNSPSLHALLQRSSVFADQLEQTVAERLIWGDADGAMRNITMQIKNRSLKTANVDMEFAFDTNHVPHVPSIDYYQGRTISGATLQKIGQFESHFSSGKGKDLLASHLSSSQTEAMMERTAWLRSMKHFPVKINAD